MNRMNLTRAKLCRLDVWLRAQRVFSALIGLSHRNTNPHSAIGWRKA